jgi:hypothetical protein
MLSLFTLSSALLLGPTVAPLRAIPQQQQQRAGTGAVMSTRGVVITGGAAGVGYAYADEVREPAFLLTPTQRALCAVLMALPVRPPTFLINEHTLLLLIFLGSSSSVATGW